MSGIRSLVLGMALAAGMGGGAQAAYMTYFGNDDAAPVGGPFASSTAVAGFFLGVSGPVSLLTFEGLAPGAPLSFSPAAGVTLSRTGDNYGVPYTGVNNTNFFNSEIHGFNVTPGGDTWFGAPEGTMTFSFDVPVTAWGAFLTGMENALGGDIVVTFNNGAPQSENVVSNPNGGVEFFGIVSDTPFSSVTLSKTFGGDAWGIDDVYYSPQATPEPASAALLAAGLAGLLARRRRG